MNDRNAITRIFLLFGFGLFGVVGCSKPTGTISGKVTFKGELVTNGTVNFTPVDGGPSDSGYALIKPDGTYTATIPTGKMKVSIILPSEPTVSAGPAYSGSGSKGKMAPGAMKKNQPPKDFGKPKDVTIPDNYFPQELKIAKIPNKYKNPDSSGLTVEVKKGENAFDIPLN